MPKGCYVLGYRDQGSIYGEHAIQFWHCNAATEADALTNLNIAGNKAQCFVFLVHVNLGVLCSFIYYDVHYNPTPRLFWTVTRPKNVIGINLSPTLHPSPSPCKTLCKDSVRTGPDALSIGDRASIFRRQLRNPVSVAR